MGKIIKAALTIMKENEQLAYAFRTLSFTKRVFSNTQFLREKENKPSEIPTVETKQPVKMLL